MALVEDVVGLHERDQQILGFYPTFLAKAVLPLTEPDPDLKAWIRRNGNWELIVQPGVTRRDGVIVSLGYPYGLYPRLIMALLCSKVVKTRQRTVLFGRTVTEFMHELNLEVTGGPKGTLTLVRDQARRLFEANISSQWVGPDKDRDAGAKLSIAAMWNLEYRRDDEGGDDKRMPLEIRLTSEFYEAALKSAPFDDGELKALTRATKSPMAVDLFFFINWRLYSVRREILIPWVSLMAQLGGNLDPDDRKARSKFKTMFAKYLAIVKTVLWRADVELTKDGLVMRPSLLSVPPRGLADLYAEAEAAA